MPPRVPNAAGRARRRENAAIAAVIAVISAAPCSTSQRSSPDLAVRVPSGRRPMKATTSAIHGNDTASHMPRRIDGDARRRTGRPASAARLLMSWSVSMAITWSA